MADDDYSAQLSWQSQSKDNLKVLMDNFTPKQYERFEAYRRHALPKQAVRKVIQQSLGQQVSMPMAQVVARFTRVFVGEIVEKARAVQARRGEKRLCPLTTYARRTGCTSRRRGVLAPLGHYVGGDCSCDKHVWPRSPSYCPLQPAAEPSVCSTWSKFVGTIQTPALPSHLALR
jgi:transcription initiation factor TFIID subunit 11